MKTVPGRGELTVRGKLTYSILWKPTLWGFKGPRYVKGTLIRQATTIVPGSGSVEVRNGAKRLYVMDSSNNFLSGSTADVAETSSFKLPMVRQRDGTYLATGSVMSDTLVVKPGHEGKGANSIEEIISVWDLWTPAPTINPGFPGPEKLNP